MAKTKPDCTSIKADWKDYRISMAAPKNNWTTYLLLCADGSFYCGITNCLERRLEAHNSGKGSRYTRARLPVSVAATRDNLTHSQAARLEVLVKRRRKSSKIKALHELPV